ncbi:MAG: hypothetical protein IKM72_10140 [Oscillospiraceae bacterium]|nr:hypothetical protein [Oscillospiraceae bacterium]
MKNENVRKILKLSLAAIVLLVVLRLVFLLLSGFTGFGNENELQSADGGSPGFVTEAPLQIFTDAETAVTEAVTAAEYTETAEITEESEAATVTEAEETVVTEAETTEAETEEVTEEAPEGKKYVFRNSKLLNDHYKKHGEEMGFASAEEYEKSASDVVNSPEALHKKEKDDNDDVYYIEDTNEFVVVSSDGYLRTYFNPDKGKAYYDRQ